MQRNWRWRDRRGSEAPPPTTPPPPPPPPPVAAAAGGASRTWRKGPFWGREKEKEREDSLPPFPTSTTSTLLIPRRKGKKRARVSEGGRVVGTKADGRERSLLLVYRSYPSSPFSSTLPANFMKSKPSFYRRFFQV